MMAMGSAVRAAKAGWAVSGSETLTDHLMERGLSLIQAMGVCRYVAMWGLYREATGVEPESVDQIIERVKVPRRTAFKWQKSFREAFPEYQSPAVLWEMVKSDVRAQELNSAAVQVASARAS